MKIGNGSREQIASGVCLHNIHPQKHATLAISKHWLLWGGTRETQSNLLHVNAHHSTADSPSPYVVQRHRKTNSPFTPAKFWLTVTVDGPDDCWFWEGARDKDGYGITGRLGVGVAGNPLRAHRAAWMLTFGPITVAQHVLHRCDVRNCVNPAHLFIGDHAANMRDAASKGRLSTAHPAGRTLSGQDEEEIKRLYVGVGRQRNGFRHELAARFGITPHYVSMIGHGSRTRTKETQA